MSALFWGHRKRISLQAFEPDHIPMLHTQLNHLDLVGRRYLPDEFSDDLPLSYQEIEAIHKKWTEKKKGFNLAVTTTEGGELAGHISCDWGWDTHCPQVAVVIYPDYQRCGYGGEGLQTILNYLFQNTPAYNVSGWVADWNLPGLNFALKCGFIQCGRSRRARIREGAYSDDILVDILRDEWTVNHEESSHGA